MIIIAGVVIGIIIIAVLLAVLMPKASVVINPLLSIGLIVTVCGVAIGTGTAEQLDTDTGTKRDLDESNLFAPVKLEDIISDVKAHYDGDLFVAGKETDGLFFDSSSSEVHNVSIPVVGFNPDKMTTSVVVQLPDDRDNNDKDKKQYRVIEWSQNGSVSASCGIDDPMIAIDNTDKFGETVNRGGFDITPGCHGDGDSDGYLTGNRFSLDGSTFHDKGRANWSKVKGVEDTTGKSQSEVLIRSQAGTQSAYMKGAIIPAGDNGKLLVSTLKGDSVVQADAESNVKFPKVTDDSGKKVDYRNQNKTVSELFNRRLDGDKCKVNIDTGNKDDENCIDLTTTSDSEKIVLGDGRTATYRLIGRLPVDMKIE